LTSIQDLKSDHKNARKRTDRSASLIKESLEKFGAARSIVIDEENRILAGNGTIEGAKAAGIKNLRVIETDGKEIIAVKRTGLTEEDKVGLALADNRTSDLSEWDAEMLKQLSEEQDLEPWFDEGDLAELIGESEKIEGLTDPDDVPEVPEEPITKEGDLYILGNHRLLCGDSFIVKNVDFLLNGTRPELLFTDPPYELQTEGGGILKKSNSMKEIRTNKVDKFNPLDLILFAETNIFFHNKPLIKKYIDLAEKNKKNYDLCFYKKENIAPNYGGHMMTDVEYIALIGKQNPNKGFQKEDYSKVFIGKKDSENKLSYSKPVAICEKFIKLYSISNVLDLFAGSGSSLIAAERLKKVFFGMEKNPVFCDVIVKRWEDFTGNKAKHVISN
tara:strand:- start:179 stop:1342 length:1164 start_codon:yes stop_codon:yes gene_type:complete